jgi:hypothetical protein
MSLTPTLCIDKGPNLLGVVVRSRLTCLTLTSIDRPIHIVNTFIPDKIY